jgi:tetratricopeptide (TPR) repeat protein
MYALRAGPGREAARRALAVAEATGDAAVWAAAAVSEAWFTVIGGDLAEGFAALERAYAAAGRDRPSLAWMASNTRGQLTWGLGDPDGAEPFFTRLASLPYADDTPRGRTMADSLGRCHVSRGELEQARARLPDAQPSWATHALRPLVDLWDGRWDRVAALAREVLDASRPAGNRWDEWAAQHLAARVLRVQGRPDAAVGLLEAALAIVDEGGARYFEPWVLPDLARALVEAGRVAEARPHADRVTALVEGGEDWRGRRAVAEVAQAVVLGAEERHDEADARFAAARERLRAFRLVGEEADCLHAWGLALARAGDHGRAAAALDEAAALYRAHGAGEPWLRRVAAAAPA